MRTNFIFSGFGYSAGKYEITNNQLSEAARNGYLEGFSEELILMSNNYLEYKQKNPETNPFDYFVSTKMGMKTRHHVSPFPPSRTKLLKSEDSLDLAVDAIEKAIENSGIHPENIDAWIISTVSPHEQAPGIAATIKCYFVKSDNQTQAISIASGCTGFNLGLQRAIEFLTVNKQAKNVVVAHTETMSAFLTRKTEFVHLATFGDACGAVILTKTESEKQEGILSIVNNHDIKMVDFVGVDKSWNLYMDNVIVKNRAIINIEKASKQVLSEIDWRAEDLDMLVPHQTGDAILHKASDILGVSRGKLYQEVQRKYGNVSGACVPVSYAKLFEENRLLPGMKIISPTAGVGGEYGAFTYKVPEFIPEKAIDISKDLQGKTALVTGITGTLGFQIVVELAKRGANLILQYNSNTTKAEELSSILDTYKVEYKIFKSDFSEKTQIEKLIHSYQQLGTIDYLVHSAGVTGDMIPAHEVSNEEAEKVAMINQFIPVQITKGLKNQITDTILYVGTSSEDGQFADSTAYVSAKKGLHGFAGSFAKEIAPHGIRSIYYMPGLLESGMTDQLSKRQISTFMLAIGQEKLLDTNKVAQRIVKSLYITKVPHVQSIYEDVMIVRRDGYRI